MTYHVYNLTNITATNNINELITVANNASNGMLVGLFIILIWLVLMFSFLRFDWVRALTASSFICFLLSTFLVSLNWINIMFLLAFAILTALGGFFLYIEDN